ncbi:Serine acetyltransferase 1, chloroplastic [Morella rubra]|uniref:serine O-acetyltransferase n=1 Tax=Morella rubra TaxID=262757 RepID=A0A6A1UEI8_9ROSI|nr:Serine acetyltransferase 1, chloroplastic [Morella rubra]
MAAACFGVSRTAVTEPNPLSQDPNGSQFDDNKYSYANLYLSSFTDLVSRPPICLDRLKTVHTDANADEADYDKDYEVDEPWLKMQDEARFDVGSIGIPHSAVDNRVSQVFAVDIHPGARIGRGILLDHATGVVIGETAVVGNNVSILQKVTLGGTGKASGDRHPKIGNGVLIDAGTCILGNIRIGDGAKIGAGSVVLRMCQQEQQQLGTSKVDWKEGQPD